MKLTAPQRRRHESALARLAQAEPLGAQDRIEIVDGYHPGAVRDVGRAGIFFTPRGLARDAVLEVPLPNSGPLRAIDVGAGIGALGCELWRKVDSTDTHPPQGIELTCIEIDESLVEVGRKMLPWATWICGDAFDQTLWENHGLDRGFDCMFSNPPYGLTVRGNWLKTKKSHLAAAELASRFCTNAVLILPQSDLPFRYSGAPCFESTEGSALYQKWERDTGHVLRMNCGLDTSGYRGEWKGASPKVEIAIMDRDR